MQRTGYVRSSWPKGPFVKSKRVKQHDYDTRSYRALTDQGRAQIRSIDRAAEYRYRGVRRVPPKQREEFVPFLKCGNCGQYTVERVGIEVVEQKTQRTVPEKFRNLEYRRCACCGQLSAKVE